jgi:RNA polymerase sigma factor (TIGR02999 family)
VRQCGKRGAGSDLLPIETDSIPAPQPHVDLVALADALDALAEIQPRASQVIELRFFGGFSVDETAEALDVSPRTVNNDWNTARAWLHRQLARQESFEPL